MVFFCHSHASAIRQSDRVSIPVNGASGHAARSTEPRRVLATFSVQKDLVLDAFDPLDSLWTVAIPRGDEWRVRFSPETRSDSCRWMMRVLI